MIKILDAIKWFFKRTTALDVLQSAQNNKSDLATSIIVDILYKHPEYQGAAFNILADRKDERSVHAVGEWGYTHEAYAQKALESIATNENDYAIYSIGILGLKYPDLAPTAIELLSTRTTYEAAKYIYAIGMKYEDLVGKALQILSAHKNKEMTEPFIMSLLSNQLITLEYTASVDSLSSDFKKETVLPVLRSLVDHFAYASSDMVEKAFSLLQRIDTKSLLGERTYLADAFIKAINNAKDKGFNPYCPQRAVFRLQLETASL